MNAAMPPGVRATSTRAPAPSARRSFRRSSWRSLPDRVARYASHEAAGSRPDSARRRAGSPARPRRESGQSVTVGRRDRAQLEGRPAGSRHGRDNAFEAALVARHGDQVEIVGDVHAAHQAQAGPGLVGGARRPSRPPRPWTP